MFKLTEAADLEKAGTSLGNYFHKQLEELAKTHAHHAALAAHHDAMKAAHTEYAAHHKATHDGMADDHDMKAHMAKGHTHHTSMAAHHEALSKAHASHAETLKAQIDNMKSVAADWGATAKADGTLLTAADLSKATTVDAKFQIVTDNLVTKALETIATSPRVAEMLEGLALDHVNKLIGQKIGETVVPSKTLAINPNPGAGLTAVPRTGAAVAANVSKVPLEFQKFVTVESEDE